MYHRDLEILAIGSLGYWVVLVLLQLLLTALYLGTLNRALAACSPARRTMAAGLVWLNLVPAFHLFWKFWTANQLSTSLRNEFDARGMRTGNAFGRTVGILTPTLAVLNRIVFWGGGLFARYEGEGEIAFFVLLLTDLLGTLELLFLIIHWTQISGFNRQLHATRATARDELHAEAVADEYERDFDEDYRPYRVRRRRQDEQEYEPQ